ncbi:MAG: acyl-CoA thioesterase [Actinomycetota bacterium]|nr:acyl-CoA thioesterase [Actinomycetota bacterium]
MTGRAFVHSTRVRPLDCDRQGVVGHPLYLHFFEAALIELWREALGPYEETVAQGVDLAVAETNVRYLAPARFDDMLEVAVTVREIGTTAVVVRFDVSAAGVPVVRGETRYVCVATASGAKQPVPDAIRRALSDYMVEPAATPAS